jgi:large subunit ribosomal protein L29
MKASEIRELTVEEKHRKVDDLKEELFNLRFQKETGQLENPQKVRQVRQEIARLKTIIREQDVQDSTDQTDTTA